MLYTGKCFIGFNGHNLAFLVRKVGAGACYTRSFTVNQGRPYYNIVILAVNTAPRFNITNFFKFQNQYEFNGARIMLMELIDIES